MKAKALIELIPDHLFEFLATETQVDYKVHKLTGRTMFQLILYTLLTTKKGSLRVMETVFQSYAFKIFSKTEHAEQTKYNSIRDRINTINALYFEQLFDEYYNLFSNYLSSGKTQPKIIRYDSTMVALSGKLLTLGMKVGSKTDKKQIKFTIGFDGLLPKNGKLFKNQAELSEHLTLRNAILSSSSNSKDTVVFDRGLQSRKTFHELTDNNIHFVTRIKTNTRFQLIEQLPLPVTQASGVMILDDQLVYLYDVDNQLVRCPLRLIRCCISKSNEPIYFLTNMQYLSAYDIAGIYKLRWDIEVFFRFLKQEMNFRHLIVKSENAMKVMLHVTLITAMLVIAYKEINKLKGYKIPKLKLSLELEEELIKQIVIICGGEPNKMRTIT